MLDGETHESQRVTSASPFADKHASVHLHFLEQYPIGGALHMYWV
jgi:hypothetical protein